MKVLADTNIFLEVVLRQEKSGDVKEIITKSSEHEFYISDYSFHSIGLLLFRKGLHPIFLQFVNDMFPNGIARLLTLRPEDMESVIDAAIKFNLDFDDAYQYATAKKYNLTILSFDKDFDRTDRGRKTPSDMINR